jgi:hypothetical protein
MKILASVQKNYPAINAAAVEFVGKLTGNNIVIDLCLSAEMAGLMLLRGSKAELQGISPGTVILGAVSDDAMQTLNQFVFRLAMSSGLNPKEADFAAMSADSKEYLPQLAQFQKPFLDTCEKHGIAIELFPFVAAAAGVKLMLAGNQLKLLSPKIGFAMLLFHIIAGSKTAPYPAT